MGQLMQKNAPQLPHHTLLQFVEAFYFGCQATQLVRLTSIVIFIPMSIIADAPVKRVWCLTDNVCDDPHAFGAFKDLIVFSFHFILACRGGLRHLHAVALLVCIALLDKGIPVTAFDAFEICRRKFGTGYIAHPNPLVANLCFDDTMTTSNLRL